jgi:uncharacterized membrane protein
VDRGRRIMEFILGLLCGFAIFWGGFWTYKTFLLIQDPVEIDYNMIEKSLSDFVDSKYDSENYLGKAEGTK